MLPLSPDSPALGTTIDFFDPLGVALLGGSLPLPLSLRWSTTRAFSECRAVEIVGYSCDLVFYNSARHLFSLVYM